LQKDIPFVFDDDYVEAFEILKKALITAPIVQPPDWNLPFEIMCDASDYAVGAVLGQRVDKKLNVIQYASKTLDTAQRNYGSNEKEFFSITSTSPVLLRSQTSLVAMIYFRPICSIHSKHLVVSFCRFYCISVCYSDTFPPVELALLSLCKLVSNVTFQLSV